LSFEELMLRTWKGNHLFSVLVELTYRCNLDCYFCYNDLALRGKPLSTEQYFAFFAELRDLQVLNLTLTGGEPLSHPDFLRLGARARELDFVVRIKSNGHILRGAMARRIRDEIDPFLIEISLHGATAEVHDRQTRIAGSFDRLMENLREARRLGLRIKLNAPITAYNEHEVEAILDLADSLDLPLQIDPEVTPRDDGDRQPLSIAASRAGVLRVFELLAERAERARLAAAPSLLSSSPASLLPSSPASPSRVAQRQADDGIVPTAAGKHCGAGSAGIAVNPYGDVFPCVQWRRSVGNLHDQSIREIWASSPALSEIRAITMEAKKVVDGYGEAGALLAFCPGNAAALTGDPLAVYPGAVSRMELAQEAQQARLRKKSLLPVL
jgi:MoaA/NifB/PqqE/SkfB family radical SAM enzyme